MAVDPICGMTVDESTGLTAVKDGVRSYFCSEYCRHTFIGIPPPAPRASSAPFYCPMCPGVESNAPGLCPKCGMALERSGAGQEDTTELDEMTQRLGVAFVLGLPVFILAMGPMVVPAFDSLIAPDQSRIIQMLLATPVVAACGWPLFHRAWQSLKSLHLNMFTLIGLGVGTAYGASLLALLAPGLFPDSFRHHGDIPIYFEAASTITILVLLGQVMELRARRKTGESIRQLLKLAPSTAFVLRNGIEEEVPLEQIHPGDTIRVKPGGKVPVDGIILEGLGSLDRALLTGEAEPVEGCPGTEVAAGTVNLSGAFIMQARKVGADTLFARIIALVSEAQRSRAPIQNLADRVASIFVPAVVVIALLTFTGWYVLGPEPRVTYALINAVSVLIIACPCALGLATPMAVMVGIGRGARSGILIRHAAVLETLRAVDILVVDKTGTLTEGKPHVVGISGTIEGLSENVLLSLAAAIEEPSEHPLGQAIVREARQRGLTWPVAEAFQSHAGLGVSGRVGTRLVTAEKWPPPPPSDPTATGTQIAITVDGRVAGTITLRDKVRDSAKGAVDMLYASGIHVIMLTGDNPAAAESVGQAVGIDTIHAGVSPVGKQELIQSLKSDGHCVAMAGDGINDAPALALADVGIAMGTGTDVAMETAEIVLVKGDLNGIAQAIRLSRCILRNVRENLFWASIYNIAGITIASGALHALGGPLMNPMLAALAMSFSSVSVIANALRLRRLPL